LIRTALDADMPVVKLWSLTVGLTLISGIAFAQDRGVAYGKDQAFSVMAPAGWTLDNRAGRGQGFVAVLYPTGSSWKESPVVMYANTAAATPDGSVETFIQHDVETFQKHSPKVTFTSGDSISTADGARAMVCL
jgi:hypothetical protein